MKHLIFIIGSLAIFASAELPNSVKDKPIDDNMTYLDGKANKALSSITALNDITAVTSKSVTGYTKLPSGIIVQWGKYTGGANSPTITFPKAFTAIYSVTTTMETAAGLNGASSEVFSVGTTSFVCNQRRHDAAALTNNFFWIAIGI